MYSGRGVGGGGGVGGGVGLFGGGGGVGVRGGLQQYNNNIIIANECTHACSETIDMYMYSSYT